MKNIFLFFALIALSFTSCKKDKTTDSDQLVLLTSKSWKPALADKNSSTNPTGTNLYHATLDCEKDDNYLFNTSNKLTITRGQEQCNSNEENSELTDYSVDFNSKKITVKGTIYTLAEVSSNQLKYYAVLPFGNNIIYLFEH